MRKLIELKVKVDDLDSWESKTVSLPCNLRREVDLTHDLQICEWEGAFSLGSCDEIVGLNGLIEEINTENPEITLDLLTAIFNASDTHSLDNEEFVRKICCNDFMFEEIGNYNQVLTSDEEKCAYYLAVKKKIPFARGITDGNLKEIEMVPTNMINWRAIWVHYRHMGFKIVQFHNMKYVFHWGNADM